MKLDKLGEVPVWQAELDLKAKVAAVTKDKAFRYRDDIANQLKRAVRLISTNLAEGFKQKTTKELITFLYYSKGAADEVCSICNVIEGLAVFENIKPDIAELKTLAMNVARQLGDWTDSLHTAVINGNTGAGLRRPGQQGSVMPPQFPGDQGLLFE
jgi:four helix bundle protein